MIHLSVAYRLVREHGYPDSPDFFLGAIAPDAIHSRKNRTVEDKQRSHFFDRGKRKFLEEEARAVLGGHLQNGDLAAFTSGYMVHLFTDVEWNRSVYWPFREKIREEGLNAECDSLYYADCDRIDADLYDSSSWRSLVWDRLYAAEPRDFPPLLSAAEIGSWRTRVTGWFDLRPELRNGTPKRITNAVADGFLAAAAPGVAKMMSEFDCFGPVKG